MASSSSGRTPVWLWLIFGVSIAVMLVGGVMSRLLHELPGVLLFFLGVGGLATFAGLRGRYQRRGRGPS